MMSTRDPPQNKGHIQTESEGLEKHISRKWRPDEIDFKIKTVSHYGEQCGDTLENWK